MSCEPAFTFLDWDSAHFALRIGQVNSQEFSASTDAELTKWARENRMNCVYLLTQSDDRPSCLAAERAGFSLVDVRVTLERTLDPNFTPKPVGHIRAFVISDLPKLQAIAGESHLASRFYFDGGFRKSDCDELYRKWIDKSCHGWAKAVNVAYKGGEVSGFITCHHSDGASGRIGLIAVDSRARGMGLGSQLIESALQFFHESEVRRVDVITQARNLVSQRLYQRSHFLTRAVELWYHKWFA